MACLQGFATKSFYKKKSPIPSIAKKLGPAEVMHNRFLQLQKRAAEAAKAVQVKLNTVLYKIPEPRMQFYILWECTKICSKFLTEIMFSWQPIIQL